MITILLTALLSLYQDAGPNLEPPPQQAVILKADDLYQDDTYIIRPEWHAFIGYVEARNLKATIGLVAESLQDGSPEYAQMVRRIHNSPHFEIFNHGLTHHAPEGSEKYHWEFRGTSLEWQREHLEQAWQLAYDKAGIDMRTFAAPANAHDANTVIAVNESAHIDVWLFGNDDANKIVLHRAANLEFPTHVPDCAQFVDDYSPNLPLQIYQIHPAGWDAADFAEFACAMDFLLARNVRFVLPEDYTTGVAQLAVGRDTRYRLWLPYMAD